MLAYISIVLSRTWSEPSFGFCGNPTAMRYHYCCCMLLQPKVKGFSTRIHRLSMLCPLVLSGEHVSPQSLMKECLRWMAILDMIYVCNWCPQLTPALIILFAVAGFLLWMGCKEWINMHSVWAVKMSLYIPKSWTVTLSCWLIVIIDLVLDFSLDNHIFHQEFLDTVWELE